MGDRVGCGCYAGHHPGCRYGGGSSDGVAPERPRIGHRCTECGEEPCIRPFVCSKCGSAICSFCVIAAQGQGQGLEETAFPCPKCEGQPDMAAGPFDHWKLR